MLKIIIPLNNINERKYILDIIFNEFLGLKFELVEDKECKDWIIELENKKVLTIKDTFFNNYSQDLEYLKLDNIPSKIEDLDIFAASFFMLTRWEEYVSKNRDEHDRFPATESLAFKQNFLDRPVVNENVEKLKKMLLNLDNSLFFKEYNYKFTLTHDVDVPFKYYSLKSTIRTLAGDLLKRGDIKLFFSNLNNFIKSKINYKKDPFYTFDFILEMNKKYNISSYFFFMSGGTTNKDNFYNINDFRIEQLIKNIKDSNNHVGIHPSYSSYDDMKQLSKEKKALSVIVNLDIKFGRQHYLNFAIPDTWQNWEEQNMLFVSTLTYADMPGFRCGVCYEYSVFNILTRKKLKLKEKPLIVMECTIFEERYMNLNYEDSYRKIIKYIDIVKQYNGEFVLLWHNDRLISCEQKILYKRILTNAEK